MRTYIEISGRRTGKTTRLLETFHRHEGKKFIVTPFRNMFPRSQVNPEHIITVSQLRNDDRWLGCYKSDHFSNARLFWDEFDLGEDGSEFVKTGDYFVTTPKFTREDWMFKEWILGNIEDMMIGLIHISRGKYAKYVWEQHPGMNPQYEDYFNTDAYY